MDPAIISPKSFFIFRFAQQLPNTIVGSEDGVSCPGGFFHRLKWLMPEHFTAFFAFVWQIPTMVITLNLSAGWNCEALSAM
jgi:hypothetical protein